METKNNVPRIQCLKLLQNNSEIAEVLKRPKILR